MNISLNQKFYIQLRSKSAEKNKKLDLLNTSSINNFLC